MKPAPSLLALFRARGKRRGFNPGASARHRSRVRGPQILTLLGVYFLRLVFSPLIFSLFQVGLHLLSDLRSEGNKTFKLRYSGSRRPGDATKPCPISKKSGKKGEYGMSDLTEKSAETKCKRRSRYTVRQTYRKMVVS